MNFAIGAAIALAVGLTGIGGGSFTVPALVLIVGLSADASVGTAFVFAGVLRLIASPFYLAGKHVEPGDCRDPRHPAHSLIDNHVHQEGAESGLCAQELEVAALARAAHWHRS